MASTNDNSPGSPTNQQQQQQNLDLRKALSDAYSFVESQKSVQSFSALTFEDCVDQQIELISGAGTSLRPNMLDRITAIQTNLTNAIAKIKALPANAFAQPDPTNDANTPV
jgi:hypothetical protein